VWSRRAAEQRSIDLCFFLFLFDFVCGLGATRKITGLDQQNVCVYWQDIWLLVEREAPEAEPVSPILRCPTNKLSSIYLYLPTNKHS